MRIFGFDITRGSNAPVTQQIPEAINSAPQAVEKDVGSFTTPNAAMLFGQGYYPSNTGEPVTPLTSLQHDAVYACVRALASDIAKLPLRLIQQTNSGGPRVNREHPMVKLLREPNPWQHSFDFMSYLISSVVLRGNGFVWIKRDDAGNPIQLIPIHPDRITVRWDLENPGNLLYRFTSSVFFAGSEVYLVPAEDMLHIKNCLSIDDGGAMGISPIAAGQNTIALGMAVKKSAAILFKQGAQLRGVLTSPADFKATPETIQRMASSWEQAYAGNEKAHRVAFLEGGVQFNPISMTADDSQMIEARAASVEDICRLFGVPQHRVQKLDRATNNNIEQQSTDYVQNSLMPIAVAIEQELTRKLLFDNERQYLSFKVYFDEILRGDTATRGQYYIRALQFGFMTINEVRELEGLAPVAGGDEIRVQLNTTTANPADNSTVNPASDGTGPTI